MTSKIQQLLDTFMDYNPEEQHKCLEIVDKINVTVKEEFQENKKINRRKLRIAMNKKHQP